MVAAWLLGSSSMHWEFDFDLFTFLKFENPSSCSKVQVAAVAATLVAAWLLSSSSMHRKFNSDHFTFLKFENPSSGSKVR